MKPINTVGNFKSSLKEQRKLVEMWSTVTTSTFWPTTSDYKWYSNISFNNPISNYIAGLKRRIKGDLSLCNIDENDKFLLISLSLNLKNKTRQKLTLPYQLIPKHPSLGGMESENSDDKKVLRECKRHTTRRVASARYAALSPDWGGGYPI